VLDVARSTRPDARLARPSMTAGLRQVLLNLLNNAVKFTHTGRITVSLAITEGAAT
jgi:signal transduction histidine kinase